MPNTSLETVERKIRETLAEISTTRPDYPSTQAEWMYFSARVLVLSTLMEERKLLLLAR